MKAIALLLALTLHQPSCLKTDVIIVVDMSTSVSGFEAFIADAGLAFVDRFDLSEDGVRIGVIAFAGHPWYISRLTEDKKYLSLQVDALRRSDAEGSTDLSSALYLALEEFTDNGRPDYPRALIIVSDGDTQEKETTAIVARQLRQTGIKVFAVLIKSNDEQPEFMKGISDLYVATDYVMLAEEFKKLDVCF